MNKAPTKKRCGSTDVASPKKHKKSGPWEIHLLNESYDDPGKYYTDLGMSILVAGVGERLPEGWESCCSATVHSKSNRDELLRAVKDASDDFAIWPETFELEDMKGEDEVGESMGDFIGAFRAAATSFG